MVNLYNTSVDLFNAGQLEQAREGFLKISESGLLDTPEGYTANDYLAKIDKALSQAVKPDSNSCTESRMWYETKCRCYYRTAGY